MGIHGDETVHSTEGWVADRLRKRILKRELVPGDKLRQAEVAEELGVSTTPVREAFRTLSAEGLVEIDTNRGARIRSLRPADVVEVLELQMYIEDGTAALAAARMTDEVLNEAHRIHAAMVAETDPTEWAVLNRDFHLTLMSASGRERSIRWLEELFNVGMIQLSDDIAGWEGRRCQGEADHAGMIEAMRARDVEAYRAIVRQHIGAATAHLGVEVAR